MNSREFRGMLLDLAGNLEEQTGKLVGSADICRRGTAKKAAGRNERLAGSASSVIKSALRRRDRR